MEDETMIFTSLTAMEPDGADGTPTFGATQDIVTGTLFDTEVSFEIEVSTEQTALQDVQRVDAQKASFHDPKQKLYSCETCAESFVLRKDLRKHIAAAHAKQGITDENGNVCEICAKRISRKRDMQRHIETHSESATFPCTSDNCEKTFKNKDCLRAHQAVHAKTRFECPDCGKIYEREKYLKQHATVHNKPNIVCDSCGATYRWAVSLKRHSKACSGVKQ